MTTRSTDALTARYDREAGAYREWWAPVLRKAGRRLVEALAEREGGRDRVRVVLDVGAGVGTLLPDLASTYRGRVSVKPPQAQRSWVAEARRRMKTLRGRDFRARGTVVFALARR